MFEQQVMESPTETTNNAKEDNTDGTWKCKSCDESWHGEDEDRNRWIVCDHVVASISCSLQEFIMMRNNMK